MMENSVRSTWTGWIFGAIMIFLIWGPSKIPELARAIGRAKNEYQKAANEVEEYTKVSINIADQPKIQR